jgi:hypothetical protein
VVAAVLVIGLVAVLELTNFMVLEPWLMARHRCF